MKLTSEKRAPAKSAKSVDGVEPHVASSIDCVLFPAPLVGKAIQLAGVIFEDPAVSDDVNEDMSVARSSGYRDAHGRFPFWWLLWSHLTKDEAVRNG